MRNVLPNDLRGEPGRRELVLELSTGTTVDALESGVEENVAEDASTS